MRKELPASRLMSGLAFFCFFRREEKKHGGFKPWEKNIGKPWENHGKTVGKPWENGDLSKKNVDLMGCMANL